MPRKPRPRRPKPGGKVGFRASPRRSLGEKVGFAASPWRSPGEKVGFAASPRETPGGKVGFAASPWRSPGGKVGFHTLPGRSPGGKVGFRASPGRSLDPRGDPISVYPGKETAAHSRVNFREIRAPGYWQMQMRIALNTSVFAVDLLLAPSGQGYFSIDLNFIFVR